MKLTINLGGILKKKIKKTYLLNGRSPWEIGMKQITEKKGGNDFEKDIGDRVYMGNKNFRGVCKDYTVFSGVHTIS